MSRSREPIRKDPTTGRWILTIDIAQPGAPRKQHKRRFATYKEARAELTRIRSAQGNGGFVAPKKLTLNGYVETWVPILRTQVRPSTAASYERALRLRVLPTLGSRQLQSIRPADLTALYAILLTSGRVDHMPGSGLSPRSVQYTATIVGRLFRSAVRGGLLAVSPAGGAEVPKASALSASSPSTMRTWTRSEMAAFLAASRDHRQYPAWLFLATTGARRGEALGLGWSQVDLEGGSAAVVNGRVLIDIADGRPVWSSPKTASSRPHIQLDTTTLSVLRALRLTQLQERLRLGAAYHDHDLVFCWPNGQPYAPDPFARAFIVNSRRLGLPRIRLHDLRHTFATLALEDGVDTKYVADRLGHSSTVITSNIYQHVSPAMRSDVAERVAALILRDEP